ncbi:hypothetical protein D3C87_1558080 [compost metagenome]
MRAHATQHDDGEDDRRLDEGERLRRHQTLTCSEEATGETGERSAEGEGGQLDDRRIQPQRTASDFVFTQRFPGTADRHAQQAVDDEQCGQCQQQGNEVQEDHLVDRVVLQTEILVEGLHAFRGLTFEGQAEERRFLDVADAVRATGDVGQVTQEQTDDLAEAEGYDR